MPLHDNMPLHERHLISLPPHFKASDFSTIQEKKTQAFDLTAYRKSPLRLTV
jgi:hypothetical protein